MASQSEVEEPEDPEPSGLRDNFVASGDFVKFDYAVGCFFSGEGDQPLCAIIAVTEVDGAVLCAVPEGAWDRYKNKGLLPPDCLRKAVRVMVPGCAHEDRTAPEPQPSFRIWLGILKGTYEDCVSYGIDAAGLDFPTDSAGLLKLPYAKALLAVCKDHFEFATAESAPGQADAGVVSRLQAVEGYMAEIRAGLSRLQPLPGLPIPEPRARKSALRNGGAVPKAPTLPPGVDPTVARQALQAGVSPEALSEMAAMFAGAPAQTPAVGHPSALPQRETVEDSDEEEEQEALPPDGGGSQDSLERVVVQMSKILAQMNRDRSRRTRPWKACSRGGWNFFWRDFAMWPTARRSGTSCQPPAAAPKKPPQTRRRIRREGRRQRAERESRRAARKRSPLQPLRLDQQNYMRLPDDSRGPGVGPLEAENRPALHVPVRRRRLVAFRDFGALWQDGCCGALGL